MKKNLHLGFVVICSLIILSNIFLLLNSRKGGRILQEIISDITPGAIAMVEMSNYAAEIGHSQKILMPLSIYKQQWILYASTVKCISSTKHILALKNRKPLKD